MPRDPRMPMPPGYFGFDFGGSMVDPYSGPTSLLNQIGTPDDSMLAGDEEQAKAPSLPNMRLLAALLRRRK